MFMLMMLGMPGALAVERTLEIAAPATVASGQTFTVVVSASTIGAEGERIGFFQVDALMAGESDWTPLCYLDNIETSHRQEISLTAGKAGGQIKVRARIAFRDGFAGDVDYTGAALRWNDTWGNWDEPPAKSVIIAIKPAG